MAAQIVRALSVKVVARSCFKGVLADIEPVLAVDFYGGVVLTTPRMSQ